MFEQLVEVGPEEKDKERKEGRRRGSDSMLEQIMTVYNHHLLISLSKRAGFVHLEESPSSTVGVFMDKKACMSLAKFFFIFFSFFFVKPK